MKFNFYFMYYTTSKKKGITGILENLSTRKWVTRFRSLRPRKRPRKIRLKKRKSPKSLLWDPLKKLFLAIGLPNPLPQTLPSRHIRREKIHWNWRIPIGQHHEQGQTLQGQLHLHHQIYWPITFNPAQPVWTVQAIREFLFPRHRDPSGISSFLPLTCLVWCCAEYVSGVWQWGLWFNSDVMSGVLYGVVSVRTGGGCSVHMLNQPVQFDWQSYLFY